MDPTTAPAFKRSEPVGNQGPQGVKTVLGRNPRDLSLEQLDAVTWKVTDGTRTKTWSGTKAGDYLTTKGVAYIVNVGGGDWIIRIKNTRSRVMPLRQAKRYVFEALRGQRPLIEMADPLREMDRLYAAHLSRNEPDEVGIEPSIIRYIHEIERSA